MKIERRFRSGLMEAVTILLMSGGSTAMAGEALDRVLTSSKLLLAIDAKY